MSIAEQELSEAVAPICAALGLELFDLEVHARTIQITVEADDLLDLEALTAAARAVSDLLDANESLAPAGHYELEVTSPGVERRLRRVEHFARCVGSRVALRLHAGTEGARRVEGTLVSAAEGRVVVELDDGSSRALELSSIERAHTVFDWRAALAEHKSEVREQRRNEAPGAARGRTPARSGKEHAR